MIRGDINRVYIGHFSSIGENSVLHTAPSLPTGMNAKLHIGPNSLISGYTPDRSTLAISDTTNGGQLIIRGKSPRIWFDTTSGGNAELFLDGSKLNILSGDPTSNGSSRLYIKADGNVGIGTTTPAQKLDVALTATVALANQPATPLLVHNAGQSVDGRVLIHVKHDQINGASALGAGLKMTAGNVTSGGPTYSDSLIFLQSAAPGNHTIHSAPKGIKFYVDNHATSAGSGSGYNNFGDLALTLDENANATFTADVEVQSLTFSNGGDRLITGPLNEDLIINTRPNDSTEGLHLQINGSDKVFLRKDGSVGIRTTSPVSTLTVENNSGITNLITNEYSHFGLAIKL